MLLEYFIITVTVFGIQEQEEITREVQYECRRYPEYRFLVYGFRFGVVHYFKEEVNNKDQQHHILHRQGAKRQFGA